MATFKSNTYGGRYEQLTIAENVDVKNNKNVLKWTFASMGGTKDLYSVAETTIEINGVQVYHKGHTSYTTGEFPAAKGSVSGELEIEYPSDGKQGDITVVFETRVYYSDAIDYGGTMTLTNIDRAAPTLSLSTTNITSNSVTITATSNAKADIWEYSTNNGSTWVNFSTTVGNSASKIITGLSPNTTYKIKVRARRAYNHVYGTSSVKSITTIGNTLLNSVSDLIVDVLNPVLAMNWTVHEDYTHTLVIKDNTTIVLTLTDITCDIGTNNVSITLSEEQRVTILKYMNSKASFTATFSLTTYDDDTQIGNTVSKTATIKTTAETSTPIFTKFTHLDNNDTTSSVTGNNQLYIKGYSTLTVTVESVTAQNEAEIESYKVTVGSVSKVADTPVIEFGTIDASGYVKLKV